MRGGRRVFAVRSGRGPDAPSRARASALTLAAGLAAALLIAGCGGGTREDAHEPSGSFAMLLSAASFPAHQVIARPTTLRLAVRNVGPHPVPNLAVTVDSFNYISTYPGLAARQRPIWAIEDGPGPGAKRPVESQEVSQPGGGQTAFVNTWALGTLAPGQTRIFRWVVAPLKPGIHIVHYRFAAGLEGKARARLRSGGPLGGQFVVHITAAPPLTHVNPSTGQVEEGAAPTYPPAS